MSGTCTSVGASLCWPGKWAREATLVPRPHVTLKLDIRICFGTPDVFFVITIFSTLTCPIYKILPGQVSGPERFILALNHISFFSHSWWYCRVTTYFGPSHGPQLALFWPVKWVGDFVFLIKNLIMELWSYNPPSHCVVSSLKKPVYNRVKTFQKQDARKSVIVSPFYPIFILDEWSLCYNSNFCF